jgi:hypothetical protein
MHQVITYQFADYLYRQQLANAEQHHLARRQLAYRRATRAAQRAEHRMRRAIRQAQWLRAQLEAQITHPW